MENISGNEESVKFDRSGGFWNWNKCVKSIDSGNYVSAFSLSFISDFEVSDLSTEDVEVDELDRVLYSKSYPEVNFVKSPVISFMAPDW